jgi:hypothetical protein
MYQRLRQALLILGVLLAAVQVYFIAFYLSESTAIKQEIKYREIEIADLTTRKKQIDPVIAQIEELKERVIGYQTVSRKHVRMARIMDRICSAVNGAEGVWLRGFNIRRDTNPNNNEIAYSMYFTGYAGGKSEVDRVQQLSNFMLALETEFREKTTDRDGIDRFLNARFERPRLLIVHYLPPPPEIPKFENTIDFTLSMRFEMVPPSNELEENSFTFKQSNRRDPFVAPQHVEQIVPKEQPRPKVEKPQ